MKTPKRAKNQREARAEIDAQVADDQQGKAEDAKLEALDYARWDAFLTQHENDICTSIHDLVDEDDFDQDRNYGFEEEAYEDPFPYFYDD